MLLILLQPMLYFLLLLLIVFLYILRHATSNLTVFYSQYLLFIMVTFHLFVEDASHLNFFTTTSFFFFLVSAFCFLILALEVVIAGFFDGAFFGGGEVPLLNNTVSDLIVFGTQFMTNVGWSFIKLRYQIR